MLLADCREQLCLGHSGAAVQPAVWANQEYPLLLSTSLRRLAHNPKRAA